MNDHVARDFVHGLARMRDNVILPHDLAHLWVAFDSLQEVVGLDDAHEVASAFNDWDDAYLLRPDVADDSLHMVIRTHHSKILAHDLLDARAQQHGNGILLPHDQPALDELASHDRFLAEQPHQAVGHDDAHHQGQKSVRIAAEFEEEDDGRERRTCDASKHGGHGHEGIESRVTHQVRQEMMPDLGVHSAYSAAHDQRGCKHAARRAGAQ